MYIRSYSFFLVLFLLVLQSSWTNPLNAQRLILPDGRVAGELMVRLSDDYPAEQLMRDLDIPATRTTIRRVGSKTHLLQFDETRHRSDRLLNRIRQHPHVRAAQYNYAVEMRDTEPNDPDYGEQWGLESIGAPAIWDFTTGGVTAVGDTIVVAVLDSGFDLSHEDLRDNLWRNSAEVPGDGVDNDGNGFVDDVFGYDFVVDSGDIPLGNHGTSVLGIIGGKGDNALGISGVNWNIRLMVFRIKFTDQIEAAYDYITTQRRLYNETDGERGAFVVVTNASFGISDNFCTEFPIWNMRYDELGAQGVLSVGATDNRNVDVDQVGDVPSTCTSEYLLTTTNINRFEEKHEGAAFGLMSVDMGSPGQGNFSTKVNNEYGSFGGTSAAVPHLSGSVALLYSVPCEQLAAAARDQPEATARAVRDAFLNGTEPIPALRDITVTGGKLNLLNTLEILQEDCGGSTGAFEILGVSPNPTNGEVTLTYETPDFEPRELRLFDAIGRQIVAERITPNRFGDKFYTFDFSSLPVGVYIISLYGNDTIISQKVLRY